jgi:ABC-type antimicrobial peptide transport system permease subunit
MTTLDERLASSVSDRWTVFLLLASFSGVALLLASVGLSGLLAQGVRARHRELGIRLALGARDGQLFGMVLAQGLWLTTAGLAAGGAGALALTRFLGSLLVDVSATDPPALSAAAVLLLAVAVVACAIPARRAMRIDPLETLRAE